MSEPSQFSRAEGDLIDLPAIGARDRDMLVQADVNGNGKVNFAIPVESTTQLRGSDFEL